MNELQVTHVNDILAELDKAYFDIPFENSAFQTKAFVIAAQQTPGRAYRTIGLQMIGKINAVKDHVHRRKLQDIDIEEYMYKMSLEETSSFDKRRYQLEIDKIYAGRAYTEKLVSDALHELNLLYSEFKKFPAYTREMFEAEEPAHFDGRLKRQLQQQGAAESLTNMHKDMPLLMTSLESMSVRLK